MQISILMNIINIVGNAVCIFVLGMGVDGVAWPSVLSRAVAAVLILNRCYQKGHMLTVPKTIRLDGRMAKRILGIGIPSAFENSLFQAGRILVVSMISTFGTVQIAANAVASNLDGIDASGQAIGLAMITVVGRCVGAEGTMSRPFSTPESCCSGPTSLWGSSTAASCSSSNRWWASTPSPARPWRWPSCWCRSAGSGLFLNGCKPRPCRWVRPFPHRLAEQAAASDGSKHGSHR